MIPTAARVDRAERPWLGSHARRATVELINSADVDRTGNSDLAQLRALQDWFLKYELKSIPNVAEVATVGLWGPAARTAPGRFLVSELTRGSWSSWTSSR